MKIFICSPTDLIAMGEKRGLTYFSDPMENYLDATDGEGASVRVYAKFSMPEGNFFEFSIAEPKKEDDRFFNLSALVQEKYERLLLAYGQGKSDDTLVPLAPEA